MPVSKPGELPGRLLLKRVAAELLGTYGMVFAGTGAIMIDALSGGKVTHLGIGITFGLIVAAMIFTFGSISGAHINPAVTLAFALTRRIGWTVAAWYIPAQLAGGILASLTLYYLLGPTASMGATLPSGSVAQSLVLEIILTFILMAIIMSLSLEPKVAGPVAALAIGGTVGLEAIFAGPISGASMNPARSLAPAPRVMLLDEPFSNVDATLRRALRQDARRALRQSGSIAVIVTHDPEEALELADRIAVLDDGRIVQVGTPETIWRRPAARPVAALFGEGQHLSGTVTETGVATPFGHTHPAPADLDIGDRVDLLVRPTAVALSRTVDEDGEAGTVEDVRFFGDHYLVLIEARGETLRANVRDLGSIRIGDRVSATFKATGTFVYV